MSLMHRTIGIIGGVSPESTVTYYQTIGRLHREATGGHDYPRIVIGSIPFGPVAEASHAGDWTTIARLVQAEGDALAAAGADFLVIAANTLHKVVPDLDLPVPLLSILDAVAVAAQGQGLRRLGLTGTMYTMTDGFYADGLAERDLGVVLPGPDDRDQIHRIIYEELVSGQVLPESREHFRAAGLRLLEQGAEAVLLACTELEMLTREGLPGVPLLDTTAVHAEAAWRLATGRADYPLIGGTA
jgi:aspartate racemase